MTKKIKLETIEIGGQEFKVPPQDPAREKDNAAFYDALAKGTLQLMKDAGEDTKRIEALARIFKDGKNQEEEE